MVGLIFAYLVIHHTLGTRCARAGCIWAGYANIKSHQPISECPFKDVGGPEPSARYEAQRLDFRTWIDASNLLGQLPGNSVMSSGALSAAAAECMGSRAAEGELPAQFAWHGFCRSCNTKPETQCLNVVFVLQHWPAVL